MFSSLARTEGSGNDATHGTLKTTASTVNSFYNTMEISFTGGTGSSQSVVITDYDGTTKIATFGSSLAVVGDDTTTYSITTQSLLQDISGNAISPWWPYLPSGRSRNTHAHAHGQ